MRTQQTLGRVLFGGMLAWLSVLSCCGSGKAVAQDTPAGLPHAEAWKDLQYENAAACTRCHVQPGGNDLPPREGAAGQTYGLQNALLTEYAIWKTHDKHAQAYAVLKGPRGLLMGEILKQGVLKAETGCLNCHAMGNLSAKAGLEREDGISCGGCHGPSSKWRGQHDRADWRETKPADKFKQGLRDLRDPEVKATLCMSCHIGSAEEGKVVSHAMFAAGHPPLPPIEIATFARNEPQHWRDVMDVPMFKDASPAMVKNFHLEDKAFARTKLAVVGSVVALRETMKLAAARSDLMSANPKLVWPEFAMGEKEETAGDSPGRFAARWPEIAMAHSDCFSCHHDLRYPGFRQERGFGYQVPGHGFSGVRPGRPLIRLWPIPPLATAASFSGEGTRLNELDGRLKKLAEVCNARPFGKPEDVAKTSTELISWADQAAKELNDPEKTKFTAETVLGLMHKICRAYDAPPVKAANANPRRALPDYETARQFASILIVAFDEWSAQGGKADAVKGILKEVSAKLDVEPYVNRKKRLAVVLGIVTRNRDNEKLKESIAEFKKYLENIGSMPALIRVSEDRDVLADIRGFNNKDFNAGILKNIQELQLLSDEEETLALKSIAEYDPDSFLADLKRIDKLLPDK